MIVLIMDILSGPKATATELCGSRTHSRHVGPDAGTALRGAVGVCLVCAILKVMLCLVTKVPPFSTLYGAFYVVSAKNVGIGGTGVNCCRDSLVCFVAVVLVVLNTADFLIRCGIPGAGKESLVNSLRFGMVVSMVTLMALVLCFMSGVIPVRLLFAMMSTVAAAKTGITSSAAVTN